MHCIFTCLGWNDTNVNESLGQIDSAIIDVEQWYCRECIKSFVCRQDVTSAAFRDDKFRCNKIEFTTTFPKKISTLLMTASITFLLGRAVR